MGLMEKIEAAQLKSDRPELRPGDTVEVAVRVIEGRNCRAVELQTAQGRHVVMFRSDEEAGAMEAGELRSDAKIFAACVASGGQRTGSLEVR